MGKSSDGIARKKGKEVERGKQDLLKNKVTYASSSLSSKSRESTKRGSLRVDNDGKLTRRSSFQQVTTNKDGGKNDTGQRSIIPRTEPVNSCDKKDSKKQ